MKILVLNCGSSSVKYQLIDMKTEQFLAKGLVERVGKKDAKLKHKGGDGRNFEVVKEIKNHSEAIKEVIDILLSKDYGVLSKLSEIKAVGHRVVHGGERFSESTLITEEVMQVLRDCSKLAPLHNPHNINGIEAAQKLLPDVIQVAVFDTAFHQTIPDYSFLYGIPYDYYKKYRIRRYGFHGTSHFYVAHRAAELLKKSISELKIITAHLGNGCSITAVDRGKSVDTSMGFTPLEGLLMGTRSGDMDPYIPLFLMENENVTRDEVDNILNKKSGLLGLSEVSNDSREIEEGVEAGAEGPSRAFKVMTYRLKKYISAYTGILNGLDVLVFTAGIGENSHLTRQWACEGLDYLGIKIDNEKNDG
ncbi:MAG: acetate kinase, partial [bacterium]|nr:acetate kinase [bacterium]